jgi:hypothetical protein
MRKQSLFTLIILLILASAFLQGCGGGAAVSDSASSGDSPEDVSDADYSGDAAEDNSGPADLVEEDTEPDIEPQTIAMGALSSATTSENIQPGESHLYTFTKQSSGGYEYVAFALERTSGSFDPYLIVSVNGDVIGQNDDSYLSEDSPGAARVPENNFFCVDRAAPDVTFEITVRDADGSGSGSYDLILVLMSSRASDDNCALVLP